ncbi:MAG: site-specific DNA-methyltransferase [Sedimentisphaerales bacterium]|nr:site-specific DNA-methyltransferase [Sedimentisphaerales bacterium]
MMKNKQVSKLDGKSADVKIEQIKNLKAIFPQAVKDGKVDFEALKLALGSEIETNGQSYGLSWAGKAEVYRHIQESTTATLKPDKKQSLEFDTTENLFIEGDNLEVLKVLQRSYYGKVKMIYIDPPYNTGSDSFIYPDRFKEEREEYEQRAGIKDEEGLLTKDGFWRKNSKDTGHFHSNWLSMMYPRLFLARNLLREDGVIFVSIDDNEVHNLRMIMNEIFGEENFVAQITGLCNPKGRSQDKYFATNHEYVIAYSKNPLPKGFFAIEKEEDQIEAEYPEEDEDGKYRLLELRNTHREFGKHNRKNLYYPLYVNAEGEVSLDIEEEFEKVLPVWEDGFEGCWTWEKPKAKKDLPLLVGQKVKDRWKIYRKSYANGADRMLKTILIDKLFYTERGQKEFNQLFNTKAKIFQSPKSPHLLSQIFQTSTAESDIILDFFAGSCTTAHAVMALNAEDGGNRKFICVQMAEPCDEESEAFKAGFKTIADIGRERIRRASKKIKEENKGKLDFDGKKLDLGFKSFKLSDSSFKQWRENIKTGDELKEQLKMFVDNKKTDAKPEDMLYEILLKHSRFDLNVKVETKTFDGIDYYSLTTETTEKENLRRGLTQINADSETIKNVTTKDTKSTKAVSSTSHEKRATGNEIVCLAEKISKKLVEKIIKEKPEKFTCLDAAFKDNDQLKTNTALQMDAEKIEFKVI